MAEAVGTIRVDLFANLAEWREGLTKAQGDLRRFARDTDKVAKGFEKTGRAMSLAITAPLALFGGAALKAAAEAQDLQGAFNITFGDAADDATQWAKVTGDAMGRSTKRIEETAITFQEFFEDFAPNDKAAQELSKTFTVLTEDFAAFRNVSREQANEALLKGLAGSAKSLKSLGIVISDDALKAKALQLGIAGANDELTDQQKVLARAVIILEGTAKIHGEVARSTGETEEETIRAREAFNELLVTVGNDLLPVFNQFLGLVHDVIDGFNNMDAGQRQVLITVGALAAAAGPLALAIGGVLRVVSFGAKAFRFLSIAGAGVITLFNKMIAPSVAVKTAIAAEGTAAAGAAVATKQLGLSLAGAVGWFLALAPVAYEAGKAVGSFIDAALAPKIEDVRAKAFGVRDALVAQGVAYDQATAAVKRLLLTAGGDLNKITAENAKAIIGQTATLTSYSDALNRAGVLTGEQTDAVRQETNTTDELTKAIQALIGGFGPLGNTVGYTADQLQRVRDTVDPINAAIRVYTENLKLAAAAGLDSSKAQHVFATDLINSIGGLDEANKHLAELPPAVRAVAQEMDDAADFDEAVKTAMKDADEFLDGLERAREDAKRSAERAKQDLLDFAAQLTDEFDPAAAFAKQIAKIDEAFKAGKISADVYKKAKEAAFAETPEGEAQADALKAQDRAIKQIGSDLADAAVSGRSFGDVLKSIALDALKSNVLQPFFSGIVGSIGSAFGFGGTRDSGGMGMPGKSYKIGSGVQEWFTPETKGKFSRTPPDPSGMGGGVTVNVYTPDANSFRSSRRQVARTTKRALAV